MTVRMDAATAQMAFWMTQALELGLQVAGFFAGSRPGALDRSGLQPRRAIA
jgi:hypothetical protein